MKRLFSYGFLALAVAVLLVSSGIQFAFAPANAYNVSHGYAGSKLLLSDTVVPVNVLGTPLTNVPTYRAVIADLTPAASATDVTTVCGSATKTVKVTQVEATADATAAGVLDFYTFLRTASDVGGTSAVVTAASLDQSNASATATVTKWTANPASVGSGVMVSASQYVMPAAATPALPIVPWRFDAGTRNTQPMVLRGINQCLAIGFNGQTIPAGVVTHFNIEWTEE